MENIIIDDETTTIGESNRGLCKMETGINAAFNQIYSVVEDNDYNDEEEEEEEEEVVEEEEEEEEEEEDVCDDENVKIKKKKKKKKNKKKKKEEMETTGGEESLSLPRVHPPFGTYELPFLNINEIINPTYQNIREPSKGAKIVIMGKTGCGKSVLIKKLMYEKRDAIPTCVVISPTEGCSGFFSKFVPLSLIHEKYNEEILSAVTARQRLVVNWYTKTGHNPWLMLVMDDCMGDKKKIAKDRALPDLMKNSRHFNLLTLIVCHDVMDLPPFARNNLDGIFLFKVTAPKTIKKISDEMVYIPEKDLKNLLRGLGDRQCIYFDVNGFNASANDWRNSTYYFQVFPEDFQEFKFCHKQIWTIEKIRGNNNNNNDDDDDNDGTKVMVNMATKKKRKIGTEDNLLLEGMGRIQMIKKETKEEEKKIEEDKGKKKKKNIVIKRSSSPVPRRRLPPLPQRKGKVVSSTTKTTTKTTTKRGGKGGRV